MQHQGDFQGLHKKEIEVVLLNNGPRILSQPVRVPIYISNFLPKLQQLLTFSSRALLK